MRFSESFDLAFEKEKERSAARGERFAVSPATAKTLAFLWNMIALGDGSFDDIVYLDKNNEIVSIPLEQEETEKQGRKKKPSLNEGGNGTENS